MTRASRGAGQALVREALALRAWAIALLRAGGAAGDAGPVPQVSALAWRLFLRAECCALELAACVDAAGVTLPGEPATLLAAARHASLARVLTARAQLARIDAAIARMDPPPAHPLLLMKGGVAAVEGDAPSDLSDIDLLPGPGDFDAVAQLLEANGYAHAIDSPLHLKLSAPGLLSVEVHHSLTGARPPTAASDETVPVPGFRALHRMANVPWLVFALEHCVEVHPHRRGHLRDACLIAAAAARCAPGELWELRRVLERARGGAAMAVMLDFSLSLHAAGAAGPGGAAPALAVASRPDPYHRVAAMKYALVVGGASRPTTEFASRFTMAPEVAGEFFRRYLTTVRRGTRLHPEWLARRAPRLAAALELLLRLPVRLVRVARGVVRAIGLGWQYAAHWAKPPRAARR